MSGGEAATEEAKMASCDGMLEKVRSDVQQQFERCGWQVTWTGSQVGNTDLRPVGKTDWGIEYTADADIEIVPGLGMVVHYHFYTENVPTRRRVAKRIRNMALTTEQLWAAYGK